MKKLLVLLMVALLAGCNTPTSSSSSSVKDSSSNSSLDSSTPDSSSEEPSSSVEDPTTIAITNEALEIWYDETLQMTYAYSKVTVTDVVEWGSSDVAVATISETGLVTPVAAGTTTITVTSSVDETITDEVEVTVKDVILDTSYGFGNIDYANLKAENPTIATTTANAPWPYVEAVFKNVYGQKYYAEARFNVTSINYGWTWNRISLGHRDKVEVDSEHVFRGLQLSHGGESPAKKTVMMETPNTWGDTTDRSQVWSLNDINAIDFTNVKLSTLRNGDSYYYFINDQLAWMESISTRFVGVDTMPTIVVGDMHATISEMYATADTAIVDAKLALAETNRKYFPAYKANTVISENETKIQFINNNSEWPFNNIKDNKAQSFGDAASLKAGTSYKVEFDLTYDAFGDNENALVGLTMNRWNAGPNNARTISVGKFRAGLTSWDSNGNLPSTHNFPAGDDFVDPLVAGTVYHVVLTRTVSGTSQSFGLTIGGVNYPMTFTEEYVGALTLTWGCIYANATIANISITEIV